MRIFIVVVVAGVIAAAGCCSLRARGGRADGRSERAQGRPGLVVAEHRAAYFGQHGETEVEEASERSPASAVEANAVEDLHRVRGRHSRRSHRRRAWPLRRACRRSAQPVSFARRLKSVSSE